MSLPEHKQDLLDLQEQIRNKLAALAVVKLATNGEWIETNHQKCEFPADLTLNNAEGEWRDIYGQAHPIRSFDTSLWNWKGITALRLSKKKIKVQIEFEPFDQRALGQIAPSNQTLEVLWADDTRSFMTVYDLYISRRIAKGYRKVA